jgi:hypothetical protein
VAEQLTAEMRELHVHLRIIREKNNIKWLSLEDDIDEQELIRELVAEGSRSGHFTEQLVNLAGYKSGKIAEDHEKALHCEFLLQPAKDLGDKPTQLRKQTFRNSRIDLAALTVLFQKTLRFQASTPLRRCLRT